MNIDKISVGPNAPWDVHAVIEIPAGGTVELAPGGFHVMMMGLVQPLAENACVEVILTFEKAGELPVMLNVGAADAKAAPEHAHH